MKHQTVVLLSQLIAMVIFGALLTGVLFYAFRPANKKRFERASRLPLDNENADRPGGGSNGQ